MLIAEMLLLVAVNDKGHVSPWSGASFLNVGLTGALLAELAIGGQLTIAGDGTVRAEATRPDDELLADVYDAIWQHLDGRKARQVIRGLSRRIGGSLDRVVDRLVDTRSSSSHRRAGREAALPEPPGAGDTWRAGC